MRTFIALDLPENIREELTNLVSELKVYQKNNINWVAPENLHITFQFLGEVSPAHKEDIVQIISENFSDIGQLEFQQEGLQLKPSAKPHILWVRYQTDNAELITGHRKLRKQIEELGYKIDRKPLVFHATLARIKGRLQQDFIERVMRTRLDKRDFTIANISLYESILKPAGAIYNSLYTEKIYN